MSFDNGTTLHCTPYHKFYIQTSYGKKKPDCVRANNLKPGMKLIKCTYPLIEGHEFFKYSYTHGLFCADGTYNKNGDGNVRRCSFIASRGLFCARHVDYPQMYNEKNNKCCAAAGLKLPKIALYGKKQALINYIEYRTMSQPNSDKCIVTLPIDLPPKFKVPMNASINNKLRWLEGYMDGDGYVCQNGMAQTLQAVSIHSEFLHDVKLLLQTLGVHSIVKRMRDAHKQLLPNGHGSLSLYDCKVQFRLLIATAGVQTLLGIGFSPHILVLDIYQPQRSATKFIKIISSEPTTRRDITYCFKEQKRGMGMFEGILTGQCAEIIEYSDDKETAVCNLASIALPKFLKYDNTLDNSDIIIYTKSNCMFCKYAKHLLLFKYKPK